MMRLKRDLVVSHHGQVMEAIHKVIGTVQMFDYRTTQISEDDEGKLHS